MAGESAVNRAQMATAAMQVEDAVTKIRGQQSQLAAYHGELMAGWAGDASMAFTNAYDSFNADFTKVINALEGIHEKLVGTRARYEATEEANTASVNRVAGLLNR
ncbi:MAG: WXG100 family type VII secretion target [Streptosporangiaceae bacterium]